MMQNEWHLASSRCRSFCTHRWHLDDARCHQCVQNQWKMENSRASQLFSIVHWKIAGAEATLLLSHAYLQLELEEESQELVTINTPKAYTSIHVFHAGWPLPQLFSNEKWNQCCRGYPWCVSIFMIS